MKLVPHIWTLTWCFLIVQVSEFSLSDILCLQQFVQGGSSTSFLFMTTLFLLAFMRRVPQFLAKYFFFARLMITATQCQLMSITISQSYSVSIWDPTRDLTQLLTCLHRLHFQMLMFHLVCVIDTSRRWWLHLLIVFLWYWHIFKRYAHRSFTQFW